MRLHLPQHLSFQLALLVGIAACTQQSTAASGGALTQASPQAEAPPKPPAILAMTKGVPDDPNDDFPKKTSCRLDLGEVVIRSSGKVSITPKGLPPLSLYLNLKDKLVAKAWCGAVGMDILIVAEISDGDTGSGVAVRLATTPAKSLWTAKIPAFNVGDPLLTPDALYVSSHSFIGKLNLATGNYDWNHERLYEPYNSFEQPTVANELVTFPSTDAKPLIVEDRTGAIAAGAVSSPRKTAGMTATTDSGLDGIPALVLSSVQCVAVEASSPMGDKQPARFFPKAGQDRWFVYGSMSLRTSLDGQTIRHRGYMMDAYYASDEAKGGQQEVMRFGRNPMAPSSVVPQHADRYAVTPRGYSWTAASPFGNWQRLDVLETPVVLIPSTDVSYGRRLGSRPVTVRVRPLDVAAITVAGTRHEALHVVEMTTPDDGAGRTIKHSWWASDIGEVAAVEGGCDGNDCLYWVKALLRTGAREPMNAVLATAEAALPVDWNNEERVRQKLILASGGTCH